MMGSDRSAWAYNHATELIRELKETNPDFCIGAACYPEVHPESRNSKEDILYLKAKVEVGCEFLTTQMFFDNNLLYSFLYKLREAGVTVPVVAGIMPITKANQVERAIKLSGCHMPQRFISLVDRFGNDEDAMKQAGIAYATDQIIDLFANGVSVQKQTKGKYPFFYFEVKNEGETELKAVAGDLTDTAKIKKVSELNPDYIMQEEGAVINWFEIDTPTGYLSINDTVGDILATFRGKLVLIGMLPMLKKALTGDKSKKKDGEKKEKGMSVAGFKPNRTMLEMAKGFALRRAFSMLGAKFTKEQILGINKKLNKIKKK